KQFNDGPKTVIASVRDSSGATGNAPRVVNIVNGQLPFTVTFTSPGEGATVSGPVTVGMSESNGTGTITWTVRLDGCATPIFTTSNTGPTASFNWDTSAVPPGAQIGRASCRDRESRTAPTVTRK